MLSLFFFFFDMLHKSSYIALIWFFPPHVEIPLTAFIPFSSDRDKSRLVEWVARRPMSASSMTLQSIKKWYRFIELSGTLSKSSALAVALRLPKLTYTQRHWFTYTESYTLTQAHTSSLYYEQLPRFFPTPLPYDSVAFNSAVFSLLLTKAWWKSIISKISLLRSWLLQAVTGRNRGNTSVGSNTTRNWINITP